MHGSMQCPTSSGERRPRLTPGSSPTKKTRFSAGEEPEYEAKSLTATFPDGNIVSPVSEQFQNERNQSQVCGRGRCVSAIPIYKFWAYSDDVRRFSA